MSNTDFRANAFLSCSLRIEDKPFVDFVERILSKYKISVFGTVGKFSASPTNTAELMKNNIPSADLVVIAATPRYFQKDLKTKASVKGISEMLHVESGMAYMANKPIVVFAQEGTNVGNFIPTVTQYISLTGTQQDINEKWQLIGTLLNNACTIVRHQKEKEENEQFWKIMTGGLAIFGGLKLFESLSEEKGPRNTNRRRRT